jgi:fatty-acyl-CoA synthase
MDGCMMDFPLTVTHVIDRMLAVFPDVEVVTRRPDRSLVRQSYATTHRRAAQLVAALRRLGLAPGDRVATLAWNHHQHLEIYLGVPAAGAVVHTLNLRLHPAELAYIANHAKDRFLVVDRSLLPLLEKFRAELTTVERVLVVPDVPGDLPPGALDYEELLAQEDVATPRPWEGSTSGFVRPEENAAAMICYTSGTTGHPKGVVYSHRSTILHALVGSTRDAIGLGANDCVLPVVPMFHAAAWGMPYMAVLNGSKIVMPGPHLDPESLLELMDREGVSVAAGVPTIWNGILAKLDAEPKRWDLTRMRTMVIGGSAAPPAMIDGFRERHGLTVTHAWGMTETNPLGTVAQITPGVRAKGDLAVAAARTSQGVPVPFVETRHVDDADRPLAWDGKTMGELHVRGPWVARSYLGGDGPDRFTSDGWFRTGDIVTIDSSGYVRITDRSKDVVKSGGEWISSVALENALMAHPAVLEAAVFAARHPKWDERPVAAIVFRPGKRATDEELNAMLLESFPKYWAIDKFIKVPEVPRNSTGKFLKTKLRELYGDVLLEG